MAYEQMAYVYDLFMKHAPYDKWVQWTEEIIMQSNVHVNHILDLGCGTGEIAVKLAQKGYQLTGVDYSTDMLSLAAQKAVDHKVDIQWIHQDLQHLSGLNGYDLAISFCDVINYITDEDDLVTVFQHIANTLTDNGLFIFDVHSVHYVRDHLINNTFADVEEDHAYVWFCSEGETEGEMAHDLTFFVKQGSTYIRFDESHIQKTFPIHIYQKLLAKVGMEILNIYGDFSLNKDSLNENAERIFFITKKRAG